MKKLVIAALIGAFAFSAAAADKEKIVAQTDKLRAETDKLGRKSTAESVAYQFDW